jgi:hypothetical protein
MGRLAFLFLALSAALAGTAGAQDDPSTGVVFVRLIGSLRILTGADERVRTDLLVDLQQVEIGTGTGFVVSAQGWVVTNHHVVSSAAFNVVVDNVRLRVAIDVQRIEVVVPPSGGRGEGRRFSASVYASDPDLDLAVLSIVSPDLTPLTLGDSDTLASGDPVRVVGYPFGAQIDIGRAAAETVPDAAVTTGSISALRRDDSGEVRYLQTSAALNPGNSGGPIIDADGNAIGVAQAVLKDAANVGFAIPINLVKAFLRRHGLDASLPAPILTLGPYLDTVDKGIRLRLPDGYQDAARMRLRVDAAGPESGPVLHIDRLATTASLEQIETALLDGTTFERYRASGAPRRWSRADRGPRQRLSGWSNGTDPTTGNAVAMIHVIADLGREKVVARYLGPAHAMAMNRSVLQSSLAELEARGLLTAEVTRVVASGWTPGTSLPRAGAVPSPEGWIVEAGAPSGCGGLPPSEATLAMSPAGDFTVQFRAAWWPVGIDVARAARACSARAGALGDGSYASQGQWWGDSYEAHGAFLVPGPGGFWHVEMVAPSRKAAFVTGLFEQWVKGLSHQ